MSKAGNHCKRKNRKMMVSAFWRFLKGKSKKNRLFGEKP